MRTARALARTDRAVARTDRALARADRALASRAMTHRWRYEDEAGAPVAGPDAVFADRAAAEDWLGREFEALLDDGVHQVTLLDGDAELYTMGLGPA